MSVIPFDTLAYSKKLQGGGMDAKLADIQSEVTSKILSDFANNQMATKGDLYNLKAQLLSEINLNTWKIIGLLAGLQAIFHFI